MERRGPSSPPLSISSSRRRRVCVDHGVICLRQNTVFNLETNSDEDNFQISSGRANWKMNQWIICGKCFRQPFPYLQVYKLLYTKSVYKKSFVYRLLSAKVLQTDRPPDGRRDTADRGSRLKTRMLTVKKQVIRCLALFFSFFLFFHSNHDEVGANQRQPEHPRKEDNISNDYVKCYHSSSSDVVSMQNKSKLQTLFEKLRSCKLCNTSIPNLKVK